VEFAGVKKSLGNSPYPLLVRGGLRRYMKIHCIAPPVGGLRFAPHLKLVCYVEVDGVTVFYNIIFSF